MPKGRGANPPSRWTVIKGNHTEEIKILLGAMGGFKKLHPWGTSRLVKTFQQDSRMKRYTAHSIKRGAISHLLASDQEQQGLTEGLISRLAKHAGVSALSDTTLGYIPLSRNVGRGAGNIHPLTKEENKLVPGDMNYSFHCSTSLVTWDFKTGFYQACNTQGVNVVW